MIFEVKPIGLVSALGNGTSAAVAAMRAGISRLQEGVFLDCEGNPVHCAQIIDPECWMDPRDRLGPAAIAALRRGLATSLGAGLRGRPCHLLLGSPNAERPGRLYAQPDDEIPARLADVIAAAGLRPQVRIYEEGHASTLFALAAAEEVLRVDRSAICVVGGVDSLLDEELLEWLDDDERLKSASLGRQHGLCPGEAACFLLVEAVEPGLRRPPSPRAELLAVATGVEPAPFVSDASSVGLGLSEVFRRSLVVAAIEPSILKAVVGDLNGEYHRARSWAIADIRCLQPGNPRRKVVHVADCLGDTGAVTGALNLTMVACSRGWLDGTSLVFADDDHGPCAAAVVRRVFDPLEPIVF